MIQRYGTRFTGNGILPPSASGTLYPAYDPRRMDDSCPLQPAQNFDFMYLGLLQHEYPDIRPGRHMLNQEELLFGSDLV